MQPSPYNTLLAIARQAKTWLTPAHQSYVQIPNGSAIPLWSEEFRDWILQKLNFQTDFASITYNRVLRQLHQDAQTQPTHQTHLRVAPIKGGYHIDLGGPVIHLTGKYWTLLPAADTTSFHRPASSHPLPQPTQSTQELHEHLRTAFGLDEKLAKALGQWLELALRPDTLCPPLILTGELRDQAATAIRQLIDPGCSPMFPLPVSRRQANWMALSHRVLAFSIYSTLTEFKKGIIQALARGARLRLHQSDHKGPRLEHLIHRPIILTAQTAPQIRGSQIEIEINKCASLPQQEVLAALFNQMVRSIRNERTEPEELPCITTCAAPHCATAQPGAPFP